MEYYVLMRSLKDISDNVKLQLENWKNELAEVISAIEAYESVSSIQGATGEALNEYMETVHKTIINEIEKEFDGYSDKITSYVNDYFAFESSEEGIIWSAMVQRQMEMIPGEKTIVDEIAANVSKVISSVSDIVCPSVIPDMVPVKTAYDNMKTFLETLDEAITTLEINHASDMENSKSVISTLRQRIADARSHKLENVDVETQESLAGKTIAKTTISALGSAGEMGAMSSVVGAIGKSAIDNDGITAKDVGNISSGLIKSTVSAMKSNPDATIQTALGLGASENYKILKGVAGPREFWSKGEILTKEAFSGFGGVIKNTLGNSLTWVCSAVVNAGENYDEYTSGDISKKRAISEFAIETVVDVGQVACCIGAASLIAAGVAAVAAPAIVAIATSTLAVGAVAVGLSLAADWASKKFLHSENLGEFVADSVNNAVGCY